MSGKKLSLLKTGAIKYDFIIKSFDDEQKIQFLKNTTYCRITIGTKFK